MMSLSELHIGVPAEIIELAPDCHQRLSELGFNPGEVVVPIYASPLGQPRAYTVLGGTVALRKEDSNRIFVEVLDKSI